ncbi:AbrB/MazE/SpoVT family DNA-binding domain-containing protein [archaeon]|nr:AbrB/MazE/SpoVT family DNA-binding domain-containing protein [archaeon]
MQFTADVRKQGPKSRVVTIPNEIALSLGLKEGDSVLVNIMKIQKEDREDIEKNALLRRQYGEPTRGKLLYENGVIASLENVYYHQSYTQVGFLREGESFKNLPRYKTISGVIGAIIFQKAGLARIVKGRTDFSWIQTIISDDCTIKLEVGDKELTIDNPWIELPKTFDLNQNNAAKYVHFSWRNQKPIQKKRSELNGRQTIQRAYEKT